MLRLAPTLPREGSLFRTAVFEIGASFVFADLVPGRISKCTITGLHKVSVFWNIHFFGINHLDMQPCLSGLRADRTLVLANPLTHFCVVGGDFNFVEHDVDSVKLDSVAELDADEFVRTQRSAARPLAAVLNLYTELMTKGYSHFYKKGNIISRLDRWYSASPPWLLLHMPFDGSAEGNPQK